MPTKEKVLSQADRTARIRRQASFDKERNLALAQVQAAGVAENPEQQSPSGGRAALAAATGGGRASPLNVTGREGGGSLKRGTSVKKPYVELEASGAARTLSIKRSASLDRERNLRAAAAASHASPAPFGAPGDDSRDFEPVATLPAPATPSAAAAAPGPKPPLPQNGSQMSDLGGDLVEADAIKGAAGASAPASSSSSSSSSSSAAALRAKATALDEGLGASAPSVFSRLDPSRISFEGLAPNLGRAGHNLYSSFGDLSLNPFGAPQTASSKPQTTDRGPRLLSAEELLKQKKAGPKTTYSAEELFDRLDANGDGKLTKAEVVNAHGQLGLSADDAALLFDALDVDGSGCLSREEVADGLLGGLLSGDFLGVGSSVGSALPSLPNGLPRMPSLW